VTRPFFVNLPARFAARQPEYVEYFLHNSLSPEIGLDVWALDELDLEWHHRTARHFHDAGLCCSVHLPFFDLQPGSIDPGIREASRHRLSQGVAIARIYKPVHMVAHAAFRSELYQDFFSAWLTNSVHTWEEILATWPEHSPLYLENVYETDPGPIRDLVQELAPKRVGFCLDIGHWHSFGNGRTQHNLSSWVQTMSPHLRHLHLHDNGGESDQHIALGHGTIPWVDLFAGLEFLDLTPSVTMEPHTREDFEESVRFMTGHPFWFSRMGITRRRISELLDSLETGGRFVE